MAGLQPFELPAVTFTQMPIEDAPALPRKFRHDRAPYLHSSLSKWLQCLDEFGGQPLGLILEIGADMGG